MGSRMEHPNQVDLCIFNIRLLLGRAYHYPLFPISAEKSRIPQHRAETKNRLYVSGLGTAMTHS